MLTLEFSIKQRQFLWNNTTLVPTTPNQVKAQIFPKVTVMLPVADC